MKTFKNLQIGDKIFVHFRSSFVRYIDYKNGYLMLFISSSKEAKKYQCTRFHIPNNHLNANNVKVCNMMIHCFHIVHNGIQIHLNPTSFIGITFFL